MTGTIRIHEQIGRWLQQTYSGAPIDEQIIALASSACSNITTLDFVEAGFDVGDDWTYKGYQQTQCDLITPIVMFHAGKPTRRLGALTFTFAIADDPEQTFDVLLASTWDESDDDITLVCMPEKHIQHWLAFERECNRIISAAVPYQDRIYIVGGTEISFEPTVKWDDIYLPASIKDAIFDDVASFFDKGVTIYRRLELKPFRKLLLAGVPGTGKTMLCAAVSNWALQQDYFVIYVSGSNQHGAEFWKIHQALDIAARASMPTIVIVEELDAYLHSESKAQMLNVLDGSETPMNDHGTLLIATTNHPEKIDDRVMKRPGRLDRIFIIPEMSRTEDARLMLKKYLGIAWREEHANIVPDLLGKPGAFIREVALYALTQAAYKHDEQLPLELLEDSLKSLLGQIEAKDNFLTSHRSREMGLLPDKRRRNGYVVRDERDDD